MDDNTYECPNCGARIYPEMTRCPQCGQNMYPEDEPEVAQGVAPETTGWITFVGAILIGWMVASGIALVLHFVVAGFVSPANLGWVGKVILFISGPFGTLTGGYLCGIISRQRQKLLGGTVGILSLPVSVLLITHWYEVTLSLVLSPVVLIAAALSILAGVAGGWLNELFSEGSDWKEKWRVRGWEDLLYQDLLRKVRFNGSIADRLIDYERKQDPGASRLKLIQNAIERWERDNR